MSHHYSNSNPRVLKNAFPSQTWKVFLFVILIITATCITANSVTVSSTNNKIEDKESIKQNNVIKSQDKQTLSESTTPSTEQQQVKLNHLGQEEKWSPEKMSPQLEKVFKAKKDADEDTVTVAICDEHDQVLAIWIKAAYEG